MCEMVVPLEKMNSVKNKCEQKKVVESRRVVIFHTKRIFNPH